MLNRLIRAIRSKTRSPDVDANTSVAAACDDTRAAQDSYETKKQQELTNFKEVTDVHALPPIFEYWARKYVYPIFYELDFEGVDHFYAKYFFQAAQRTPAPASFISIGAGNCDTEIRVAKLLVNMGLESFKFECLELNPHMLDRGRQDAAANGVAHLFSFFESDFNTWRTSEIYSGVMANHSLHHVVELEHLFDMIKSSLHPQGLFVTSDMIGRNGHQRWPEALIHVDKFWKRVPDSYHYNHLLKRNEEAFINFDCSAEGFEGIRAQDILPLLVERFDFPVFYGFANVIGPFVDRCFGHNFDATSRVDQALIDEIHETDEDGFRNGTLKPTQMLAVMSPVKCASHVHARGLTPEMSIRPTN